MTRTFHKPPGRENARPQQEFATVKAVLAQRTDFAILVTTEKTLAATWVPKYALNVAGKLAAERAALKSEIEIGVELNMALQKGLI